MDYFEIAFALRQARKKAGLSQEDLAKKTGFSQVHISEYESGRANVTVKTLERLAEAMDKKIRICFVDPDTPIDLDAYELLKGYDLLQVFEPDPPLVCKRMKAPPSFDECFEADGDTVRMVCRPEKALEYEDVISLRFKRNRASQTKRRFRRGSEAAEI